MATRIESDVEKLARSTLDEGGFTSVEAEVSGRHLSLKGPLAQKPAVVAVRTARAATWAGRFPFAAGVSWVSRDEVSEASANSTAPPQPVLDAAAKTPSARPEPTAGGRAVRWADLTLSLHNGRFQVDGTVNGEAQRALIEARAEAKRTPPRISDIAVHLEVEPTVDLPSDLVLRALEGLALCYAGDARFRRGDLVFDCLAPDERVAGIRSLVSEPPPAEGRIAGLFVRGVRAEVPED